MNPNRFPLLSTDNSLFILALILASLFDSFPPSDVNGLNSGADRVNGDDPSSSSTTLLPLPFSLFNDCK